MVYRKGAYAFDDCPDRGAKRRAEAMKLPPTRKKCVSGDHIFSEYGGSRIIDGVDTITVRCPDCKEEFSFPAYARDRDDNDSF